MENELRFCFVHFYKICTVQNWTLNLPVIKKIQKLMNANYGFFVFALTLRDLFYYNSAHLSHVITKVDYIKTPHT